MSVERIHIAYGKDGIDFAIDSANLGDVLLPALPAPGNATDIVREALRAPIGSPTLRELTEDVRKILLITNDNTRPMPSKITLPLIIEEFFYPQTSYDITIQIANGLHRKMTKEEMLERIGPELCGRYPVVNHDAHDDAMLDFVCDLSTGTPLYLNKRVTQSDLVISEGFIEPHFFAGFSGGRKSMVPGVAGAKTIMSNHCPQNIANRYAVIANLHDNPVHNELMEAMKQTPLRFILNVALDSEKRIMAAFSGDPEQAHRTGCNYVTEKMSLPCTPAPIVVTSNNGYPLDRNMYQIVKGIDAAARAAQPDGVIIMAAQCMDGVGHIEYYELLRRFSNRMELYEATKTGESEIDKWQVQVLARALKDHRVILVSEGVDAAIAKDFFFEYAGSVEEALEMAYESKGADARVNVIPDGPVIIPRPVATIR